LPAFGFPSAVTDTEPRFSSGSAACLLEKLRGIARPEPGDRRVVGAFLESSRCRFFVA
jgi:hypothetical protein